MVLDESNNGLTFESQDGKVWHFYVGLIPEGALPAQENEIPADIKLALGVAKLVQRITRE